MTVAKPSLLRAINRRTVFELVHAHGATAAPHVVRTTGLSKPTVSDVLAQLVQAGLLHKVGRTSGLPGPSAQLYDVNPRAGWALSLDVGRQWLRGALVDLAGNVVATASTPTPHTTAKAVIAQLRETATRLTGVAGVTLAEVNQIVVGTPGVLRPGQNHLSLAPQLTGWESPSVIPAIAEALVAPVRFENDVNMAAVGEHERGVAAGCNDFVLMSIGSGVGTGVFVDGALRRGAAGLAGEIGYMRLDVDAAFPDGQRATWGAGAFESLVSRAAILAATRRAGMRAPTVEAVFDAARRGDQRALSVVELEARRIAHGIAAIAAVLDPELVVLGGGIGTGGGDLLAGRVAAALASISPFSPRLDVSRLGVDAVIAGCNATGLALALESLLSPDAEAPPSMRRELSA